ncbi:uncharacterized protein LOC141656685 isoform X2 [Silene latifolia]
MKDFKEETPLRCCFIKKPKKSHEYVAMHLVSRDHNLLRSLDEQRYPTSMNQSSTMALDKTGASVLYCAMREGFSLLAERILTSGLPYSLSGISGDNPLHHASKSHEQVSRLLLEKHPELIGQGLGSDTVLDRAVEDNAAWLVKLMLLEDEGTFQDCPWPWNKACRRLIWHTNSNSFGDTPLHLAARKGYIDIAKLLVLGYESAIRDEAEEWDVPESQTANDYLGVSPTNIENYEEDVPLFVALKNKHDDLGVYLLSVTVFKVAYLKDREGNNVYNIAEQNGCEKSRNSILERLVRTHAEDLLNGRSQLSKVLHPSVLKIVRHFASGDAEMSDLLRSESVSRLMVEGISRFAKDPEKNSNLHLKEAAENGEDWFVKLLLEGDSTLINDSTPAWLIACAKGHLSTVLAFVEQCDEEEFIQLCRNNKQTPLHHINLPYHECKELLANSVIQKLKNELDSDGTTPLHRAIARNDTYLAKALLETEGIQLDIEDGFRKTVLHMIEERCKHSNSDDFWFQQYKELLANPDTLRKLKNSRENDGVTLLQIAIKWKDLELAKTLVCTEGVEFSIRNRNGKTDLDLIEEGCDKDDSLCYELYKLVFDNPNYLHELKNRQVGIHKNTPLHRAIKWNDINLAKTLLETNDIELDKEDKDGYTVLDLLEKRYSSTKWGEMCREIRLDPSLKVFRFKYLQRRTSLKDMNSALSVVAALLATITFAAGFTVPGGLNSEDGTATLGTKPAFLVFSIANTVAMCSSMVVLFMLIGAMIWEAHPKATPLIDLCVSLLQLSLCGTIVAFMTGVYAIMAPKVKWVAIIVIILCSLAFVVAFVVVIFFWPLLYKPFKLIKDGVFRLVSHLRCGDFCGSKASSDDGSPPICIVSEGE